MKGSLVFAVGLVLVLLGTGSTLALMNNACKIGQHSWCTPRAIVRHEAEIGPG